MRRKIPFLKIKLNKKALAKASIMEDNAFDVLKVYVKTERQKAELYDAVQKASSLYYSMPEELLRQDEQVNIVERNIENILDALEKIKGNNHELRKYLSAVKIKSDKKQDIKKALLEEIMADLENVGFSKTRCTKDIKPILLKVISGNYLA